MRTRENKCQISQNDILHVNFSEFCLCFHTSCEMGCIDDSATGVQETGVCCTRLFFILFLFQNYWLLFAPIVTVHLFLISSVAALR